MILMIDNFDSFTFNIVQMLSAMGQEVLVRRNDAVSMEEIAEMNPQGIVISPGPGSPKAAGVSLEAIRRFHARLPILGVCLGHQCMAEAFGGRITHAARVMHGKRSAITHDGTGLFADIPQGFMAVRYHSLAVDRATCPDDLAVCAQAEDGEIMGFKHTRYPLYGIQFHPESIATEYGQELIAAFIEQTRSAA